MHLRRRNELATCSAGMLFAGCHGMLTDEGLHGRLVLSGDGVAVGEIVRLLLDPSGLRVRAMEVRLRRDAADRLGFRHGVFRSQTIEVSAEQVQSIGDAVILMVPLDGLRAPQPDASPPPA